MMGRLELISLVVVQVRKRKRDDGDEDDDDVNRTLQLAIIFILDFLKKGIRFLSEGHVRTKVDRCLDGNKQSSQE